MTAAMLQVSGLGHRYGDDPRVAPAIEEASFVVHAGELVSIVGPSGCGKSTLLRAIAGLHQPTRGEVVLHGDQVRAVPDDLAVVFQDYSRSLFPWLTVEKNIAFPLKARMGRAERGQRVTQALVDVGLHDQRAKFPWQLSGGMQQRVSIARALAYRPSLMLMDEPFASVDAQTRGDLEDLLRRVRHEHGMTVLLVTHDIDESIYLSDRVVVLSRAPATIVATLTVDLPADRDQITTRGLPLFVELRTTVARLLRH